ncbi:hypothetical protein AGMMS49938_09060 [Fibrobacterales bacterium]|nr:hypothetical protein AGMMS49938_09060 [Fibrobacterales bacterium]
MSEEIYKKESTEMLFDAVKNGDLQKVKDMLLQGVKINANDDNGYTPLNNAAYYGNLDVVKFLLEKGANINAIWKYPSYDEDEDYYEDYDDEDCKLEYEYELKTPIDLAAKYERDEVVKFLKPSPSLQTLATL